ncbi:MAG: uroporphyrinogen decarboxylase family protein [bacterium]
MKRNMFSWVRDTISSSRKKPIPLLSSPSIQLMGISVKELISDSQLQAKGMQLVAQRVDTAASVSLMDLSVEAECFGSEIRTSDDEVPTVVGSIVVDKEQAKALQVPAISTGRAQIYLDAIEKAVKLIQDRPVFAGVIGPFSLASRLIGVSDTFVYCYEEPDIVHIVLEKCTVYLKQYIQAYRQIGANGVVVAEPLAGLLSPALAKEFSANYMKRIVDDVQDEHFIVVYHNCGSSTIKTIDSILEIGAPVLHFGNSISMRDMLKYIPGDVLVLGNIDPAGEFRNGTPASIRSATLQVLEECSPYPNFVISSGCDIPPLSPWENIEAFFAAIEDFYKEA